MSCAAHGLLQALYANDDDVKACLMRIKTLMMGEESARDVPDHELEEIPVPAGMTAGESQQYAAASLRSAVG